MKDDPAAPILTAQGHGMKTFLPLMVADIGTVREFEDALRDVLGFSHAAAMSIAQCGFMVANEQPLRLNNFVGDDAAENWMLS